MSGRELASISMLHTHNCGNSSPFFCQKCYPLCETVIFEPLWVASFVNFGLSRPQVIKSCIQKLKFRYVEICPYFFHIFLTTLWRFKHRMYSRGCKKRNLTDYRFNLLTYMGVFLLGHSTPASPEGLYGHWNYGAPYYYYSLGRFLRRAFFNKCLPHVVNVI